MRLGTLFEQQQEALQTSPQKHPLMHLQFLQLFEKSLKDLTIQKLVFPTVEGMSENQAYRFLIDEDPFAEQWCRQLLFYHLS
ncbi:hypothetical protein D3C80_770160 [compost metagenome]